MSPRPARSEPRPRAHGAVGVLLAAVAILLFVAYPLIVREVLGAADGESSVAAALLKLPPFAIDVVLAWSFLATLGAGREPVISRFARLERGTLPPDLAAYTRRLTALWGSMFVVMALACLILSAPETTLAWQWWTSAGTWVCVAALFVGERFYRKRRFPHYAHATLARQLSIVVRNWRP